MYTYDKEYKVIARAGKTVGCFDEATGIVRLGESLPPALKGQLRKVLEAEGCGVKGFTVLSLTKKSETSEVDQRQTANDKMTDGAGGAESNSGADAGEGNEVMAMVRAEVPACPPIDPRYGDKTPGVVEWCRDHDPAEFVLRYKGRKTHLVEAAIPS